MNVVFTILAVVAFVSVLPISGRLAQWIHQRRPDVYESLVTGTVTVMFIVMCVAIGVYLVGQADETALMLMVAVVLLAFPAVRLTWELWAMTHNQENPYKNWD